MRARSRCNISVVRERSVFVRSVSWENGRVIKSIGAPASGEGSEPGLGFRARWRRRGEKGPRITSGGPYSPRRSGLQTCVHPVLSALACARRKQARIGNEAKGNKKKKERRTEGLPMRKTRFLDSASLQRSVTPLVV
ncbi:hypothetical protein ALC62_01434 [Cyphomyrmex costatus]|uniref:Uncharacterized protein n=1 Tax=Cyphomyrmex costatus TaxID=456900 RepID=A0A195D5B3_9HYME|nr:hypothetical protein ALC62_01434 [Cyphomyrmex costatus]